MLSAMKARDRYDRTAYGALMHARALIAMDASKRSINKALKRARKGMSDLEEHQRSSLALELAGRYADVGDLKEVTRMIALTDDKVRSWGAIILNTPEIGEAALDMARKSLNKEEMAALLAKVAKARARSKNTAAQKGWAEATVWAVLNAPIPPLGEKHHGIYDDLLIAAHRLENATLINAVLERYVSEALASRSSIAILQVAALVAQLENRGHL
jgi:hypothetical protein